jgi:NADH dehydrogenase [ubiquinone] 1 alpha subcomplex assembly factor 7
VLADPGEADVTAQVDFAAFGEAAAASGARVLGPVEQGRFLRRLGIDLRAERLLATAEPEAARRIAAGYRRLVDPEAMGSLFKVMAVADAGLPPLAGFEEQG